MNKLFRAYSCARSPSESPLRCVATLRDREDGSQHAVFVMTNAAKHNEVLSFLRAPMGSCSRAAISPPRKRAAAGAIDRLDLKDRCS